MPYGIALESIAFTAVSGLQTDWWTDRSDNGRSGYVSTSKMMAT